MDDIRTTRGLTKDEESVNRPVGPVSPRTSGRDIGDVRSLQRKLRNIASYNEEIPMIIDDGIFGDSTEEAVLKFQELFGLDRTGIVNFDTWNKIVEVSDEVDNRREPGNEVLIFNEGNKNINPGDKDIQLYVIQAMMKALAELIDNFVSPEVTGIHDKNSVAAVKAIQLIAGLDDNGIIDVDFSDQLGELYEVYVTRERVKNSI
ncbi:MAG: peptidoglycan-binding protein [Clostridia bacterium]|nr:peptidoglycan-binding protein [Clostridia bacterium]